MSIFNIVFWTLCMATCAVLLIVIIYKTIIYFYREKLWYEVFYAQVTVLDKEYKCSYFNIYDDEEFLVYVSYEGKTYRLDDEDLYEQAEIGKNVKVIVQKGYNKHSQLKYVYLSGCD